VLQRVIREEGVLALWRSNGVNCLRIIPVYSLKFVSRSHLAAHTRCACGSVTLRWRCVSWR
jgi:hypothetical protein